MITVREKWRMFRRFCLMFFLVAMTLAVFETGNFGNGKLGLERQPLDIDSAESRQKRDLKSLGIFWKLTKPNQEFSTGAPRTTEVEEPRSWDVTSVNCTINRTISSNEWFKDLEPNFKQFLLYRHCRFFPMILNHPEKCQGDIHLLIVIKSIITQHNRREVIRRTWGKEKVIDGKRIKTVFLLATTSNEEQQANHQKLLEYEDYIYGDILQWDFQDSFFNLTLKETAFLKWFSAYCHQVRYIFKGDDDVFVSIPNILEFLKSTVTEDLFVGDIPLKAKPIRKKKNKYYIPEALFNKTYYPPYAGGGGFLMDGPLAKRLYGASNTLDLFPIDDVFLGMCLEVLQVSPIRHNAFKTFGLVKDKKSRLNKEPCFYKDMLVVHKLLPPDLIAMWELLASRPVCVQKIEEKGPFERVVY
ncbi:UDP-GlcNAc:betaGal beta-1,3-N-acetylglucosaminyltransferase 7-like [Conger conger]|nr:UDP-GlcNAc:betaGal beta-1,3-N-acetylglucosaminyltransferase 7-like [Conger conger]